MLRSFLFGILFISLSLLVDSQGNNYNIEFNFKLLKQIKNKMTEESYNFKVKNVLHQIKIQDYVHHCHNVCH